VKGVIEAAWVHEASFVEVHDDARRGLVLSFYLSTDQEPIWLSPEDEIPQRESYLRR
jgi:hypothetical protein